MVETHATNEIDETIEIDEVNESVDKVSYILQEKTAKFVLWGFHSFKDFDNIWKIFLSVYMFNVL